MSSLPLPLIAPRRSGLGEALARVEASGIHGDDGPEMRAFETKLTAVLTAEAA